MPQTSSLWRRIPETDLLGSFTTTRPLETKCTSSKINITFCVCSKFHFRNVGWQKLLQIHWNILHSVRRPYLGSESTTLNYLMVFRSFVLNQVQQCHIAHINYRNLTVDAVLYLLTRSLLPRQSSYQQGLSLHFSAPRFSHIREIALQLMGPSCNLDLPFKSINHDISLLGLGKFLEFFEADWPVQHTSNCIYFKKRGEIGKKESHIHKNMYLRKAKLHTSL